LDLQQRNESLKNYKAFANRNIKIVNKSGDQVSFEHNAIQSKINDTVALMRTNGRPVRIIILKARQEGVSTNEQGRMIYNTTTKGNRTGLIVAHEAPATAKIFEKARYMYNNLPDDIKPMTRASNARELIFDTPTGYAGKNKGLNSKISIQVAGDVGIGRGDTIYYAHLSEFAFWPSPDGKEPKKQLSGILQAVPKTADTEVVIESTANGYNDFKELWDDATQGRNEWAPLFFAWWNMYEYQMPCTDEEYKRLFVGLGKRITEYLEQIKVTYELTKEQIKWYVWTLRNDCNGDWNMMKQENPTSPEEAFISTGNPVFDNDTIQMRIEHLRIKYEKDAPQKGRFYFEWNNPELKDKINDKSIRWVDDTHGYITLYENVSPGIPYVIGGDTKGEGIDLFSATVINNGTGNRCAVLHADMDPDTYAHQVYCLGKHYNTALIGIESNFDIYPIKELERLRYFRQYTRQHFDSKGNEWQKKYGWRTDGNTRPYIISLETELIRDNISLFNDIDMLNECITFTKDSNGRPDAMSGKHDDILFSDMIANAIRGQQRADFYLEMQHEIPDDLPEDLKQDLLNDPQAMQMWLQEHNRL
jgi:hypothetical protein